MKLKNLLVLAYENYVKPKIEEYSKLSNCFIYAYGRYKREGGYLMIRKSRLGSWFPHVLWAKDLKDAEMAHFVPVDIKPLVIPPPLFEGYVKTHDRPVEV